MKRRVAAAALAALLIAPALASAAEPITLKFGFANPPQTWTNVNGIAPWSQDVEKRSNGALAIQVFAGGSVVNQRNTYDRLLNGVVDLAYAPFGAVTDTMPRQEVTALPFESPGLDESALAAWELTKAGVLEEDFSRIRVVTVWCMPTSILHTTKEVRRLEDLRGMKLSSATRTNGEISERLGATVVSITNPEVYGALQRNMVQGLLLPYSGAVTFHLQEVTKYHLQGLPLGCTMAGFMMNKDSYAKLPSDLRAAIDGASGDAMAKHMRGAASNEERIAVDKVAASPGAVLVTLQPAEIARWRERLRPMVDDWVKRTPGGDKVLAAFRAQIAKLGAGH
jgi:TRAP-type C4-dicarboxylate transport system substrate-binding protein